MAPGDLCGIKPIFTIYFELTMSTGRKSNRLICSIQSNFIYMASVSIKSVSGETQGQNPTQTMDHGGKEKVPFNSKKPWVGPGSHGLTLLLMDSWVEEQENRGNCYGTSKTEGVSGVRGHCASMEHQGGQNKDFS